METIKLQNRNLIVADPEAERVIRLANKSANVHSPVLLVGESGTGKELIARYIHESGKRAGAPFISINCAAIPEGLIESELFGFEKGAFTGAISQQIGKFERAEGGTILLDEVSEMPVSLQAKLLRVLQESEFERLGGRHPIRMNARVIATTNREPIELISAGQFRRDLYYRLNVVRIDLPPLRGRVEAIRSLSNFFLKDASKRIAQSDKVFSESAVEKIINHTWPGNVRELQNAIERAVIISSSEIIGSDDVCLSEVFFDATQKKNHDCTLQELEQEHIVKVLTVTDGNRNEAARRLGITSRTLRNKLKEYSSR